jgi:hypothetical protein
MLFPYAGRPAPPLSGTGDPELIFEPIVLARFTGPSGADQLVRGLLDTGAAVTLLPLTLVRKMGILKAELGHIQTAKGLAEIVLSTVEVGINLGRQAHKWKAQVGFIDRPDHVALFGHDGFLDRLLVTFDGPKRMISIRWPA